MPTPAPSNIEHDPRWARVLARDASADGQFVYAVKTTGVYCQPSSPSRLPRPENVEFFDTPAEAEAAGQAYRVTLNRYEGGLASYLEVLT
ncbi:Ada metal-binding domain-containing protein, partial [Ralstonia pseudosolanacearum]|uniref:Ada metal-binding domain-containing protein n=1 Tax=Ralstonia pseudosolanacearum TaxID=1310165 RepID=UPI003D16E045